jgi:hypothetical protein
MAYPTAAQLNFVPISPQLGMQPIATTSTTQNHPLGTKIRALDVGTLGYGEGEFIYLKGVASTAAGDLVVYDPVAGTTTRTVAATRGPVAVAMSANVASQYGWYQVLGQAAVNTASAGTGAANALIQTSATAGQGTVSGTSAQKIDGAICKAAQGTPSSGFTQVALHYPAANGNT